MITPVVLCGGSGSRLWPVSRTYMPKQLLPLHTDASLLQETLHRLDGFAADEVTAPLVVCNDAQRFLTRRQLLETGAPDASLIAEPVGRNTAPALTLAALHLLADGNDPVMVVMPADHAMLNLGRFRTALASAVRVARGTLATSNGDQDAIATFGVVPTEPATGYGYLRVGNTSPFDPAAFALDGFVEKPALELARQYVADGGYLWNSGLFILRASVWRRAMARLAPDMLVACEKALQNARSSGLDIIADAEAFAACPANSIDYAVMEKLADHPELGISGVVVPLYAGWSDIGTWDSAWDISDKDADGNVAIGDGEAIFENTRNSYVRTTGESAPIVACVGLDNAVVVQTPDAILVTTQQHAQAVRNIVTQLAERKDSRVDLHRKVFRPWGWYDSLGSGPNGAGFQVKRIGVFPGQSLSLQYHHRRAEHWVVIKGTATITVGEAVRDYAVNEHVYIPLGDVHRLENKTETDVEIIEVQIGDYLGEDDIVRLQDVYQRS